MSEPAAKPRILVIDDEPMILQILRAAFDHKEWDVEVVSEGRVALRRHRAAPFDLLIVDKNLPDIDGVSLVRELRSEGDPVRVVLITGYGTVASAVDSLNLGVAAYLEKPFRRITEVAATVEAALERPGTPTTSRALRTLAAPGAAPAAPAAPAAKPRRPRTDPRRAATQPRAAITTSGGTPATPSVATAPTESLAADDGAEEFDTELRTGRWKRQASPVSTVIIGAPDDEARLHLGEEVTRAHCQAVFAGDTMAVLVAVASHDAGLVVLVGPLGRPETVARLRAQAPDVPCVLITDQVTMAAVNELMQLQATHLITDPPGSDAARQRLAEILTTLAAAGLVPAPPTRT